MRVRNLLSMATIATGVLLPAPSALAARRPLRPGAVTGAARSVSSSAAALTGAVDPHGSATSYYFQYGLTRALGAQTPPASAGAGNRPVSVALAIGGLSPITPYYYRLVAVSGVGATVGAERTFVTTKVPLSLQIAVTPNPVIYSGLVLIQGALAGTENANREVVLQANVFPFTGGFFNVGNPQITLSNGAFSFTIPQSLANVRYRVVTTTRHPIISAEAPETVSCNIAAHITRARRRHHFRIEGRVSPALNGTPVEFVRQTRSGARVVVGRAVVRNTGFESRGLRTRRGVYRVRVLASGAVTANETPGLLVR